jgi:hypothetical protein
MQVYLWSAAVLLATAASAAEEPSPSESNVQRWRIGMEITATGGPCMGLIGTQTVPMDWPEQKVKIVSQELPPGAKVAFRTVEEGTAKQMILRIPRAMPNEKTVAAVLFEVARTPQRRPENTSIYVLPNVKKLPPEIRTHLGASPLIETGNPTIQELAVKVGPNKLAPWDRVEAVYNFVREKVKYQKDTPPKTTMETLKDGFGDCDEMCSLFIALCRAKGVPARTVRVYKHVYAEFYLEDDQGRGHWFPCELTSGGKESFGGIPGRVPILQKGDRFKAKVAEGKGGVPITKTVRYLPDNLEMAPKSPGRPQLKLICEEVKD